MDDTLFDALGDDQRRRLLLELLAHDVVDVSDGRASRSGIVDRDRLERYHVHLPKLAAEGFVEWDREADVIVRGSRFEELEPLLEFLRDTDELLAERS